MVAHGAAGYPGSMRDHPPSNIYPSLTYADAEAAIEFLCRAFGFEKRLVVPREDGGVLHSELTLGTGLVMASSPKPEQGREAPNPDARSHALCVRIDDPDAHYERAKAEGARILMEPVDEEYGARGYMAADPEGHVWFFATYSPGEWWDK